MLIYTYADVVSPIDDIHIKAKHKYSEKGFNEPNDPTYPDPSHYHRYQW